MARLSSQKAAIDQGNGEALAEISRVVAEITSVSGGAARGGALQRMCAAAPNAGQWARKFATTARLVTHPATQHAQTIKLKKAHLAPGLAALRKTREAFAEVEVRALRRTTGVRGGH